MTLLDLSRGEHVGTVVHVLDQTTWWVGADGIPVRLSDLGERHRRNLLPFIRRRAAAYQLSYGLFLADDAPEDCADEMIDAWWDGDGDRPASEWIETMPLVRHLRKEAGEVNPYDDPDRAYDLWVERQEERFAAEEARGYPDPDDFWDADDEDAERRQLALDLEYELLTDAEPYWDHAAGRWRYGTPVEVSERFL